MHRHTLSAYFSCVFHWLCWPLYLLGCSACSLLHPAPSPAESTIAQAWVAVGKEYLAEGDMSGARQALDHARLFDDTQPALWHALALCAQLEHNQPIAHSLYRQALSWAEQHAENTQNNDREYVALLNNHARLLYDEGAIYEACAEFDRAARYPSGVSNPITVQNLTLCHTTSAEPSSS